LIKDKLTEKQKEKYESLLKNWKTGPQKSTNWLAMRAYSYLLKYKISKKVTDYIQYRRFLYKTLKTHLQH